MQISNHITGDIKRITNNADNKLDLLKTKNELYKLKDQLVQNYPQQKGGD